MADWVTIARLVKTQGRHGELAAELHTDFPERFAGLQRVSLRRDDGSRQEFTLTNHWFHQGRVVLALGGIEDMNAAAALVGGEVQVPAGERVAAPEGAFFISDLVDCEVLDGERVIGRVTAVEETGGAALLHVQPAVTGDELLVPFAAAYLERVAVAERRIYMRLPEGLLEVNH